MKILAFRFGHRFPSISALQASFIVAAIIWTLQIAAAAAHADQSVKNSETKKIRITADKLIANVDTAEISFSGHVKAMQAGAVITADRLNIIYDPAAIRYKDEPIKTETIRKIIASGRVKIAIENIIAVANTAEYTIKSGVLILIGDPARVTREGVLISGPKFTIQRSDGTITVESQGESRVRAIFSPETK